MEETSLLQERAGADPRRSGVVCPSCARRDAVIVVALTYALVIYCPDCRKSWVAEAPKTPD